MDAVEKSEILDALQQSRRSFLNSVNGVTEELATRSPGEGRWSILEAAEHVAVSEGYLSSLIAQAKDCESSIVNESRVALFLAQGADRSRSKMSPEVVRPTARFATLAEAIRHFSISRGRTIYFLEGCEEDLRLKMATHPLLGPVNCYEVLALMAAHTCRHAKQICEIRTCFVSTKG